MTFAEWHAKQPTFGVNAERLAHDAWDAATSEANNRAGDASNEAEKDARRAIAVKAIQESGLFIHESELDAIIKIAQG